MDFNFTKLFFSIYKWWKHLLIIAGIAIVFSFIFTLPFFIPPKYKSAVIIFPPSTNSISKALLSESSGYKDIMEFGESEQTEQLLQVLNSNEIRVAIIKKYNLMQHYDIDSTSKYKMTKLYNEYENNISYKKTEYMAIKIVVFDKAPQIASDIANDIAALLDSAMNKMKRSRTLKGYKIVEAEYKNLQQRIKKMEDSLSIIRSKGILDYEIQVKSITRQLAYSISHNNTTGTRLLQANLDTLTKYGGAYISLRDALEYEKKQFSILQNKYREAKVDAEQEIPNKFIVEAAYKAEKKSYPIVWLIILISTSSAVLLGWLVILIIENLKLQKHKLN